MRENIPFLVFGARPNTTSFLHGTEDIKSERHKAVPQVILEMNLTPTSQWGPTETKISQTHARTNCWYSNRHLVDEFLTLHLLKSKVERDQKSLNTREPGAFHRSPLCCWQILIQGVFCMPKQRIYTRWVWNTWFSVKVLQDEKKLFPKDTTHITHAHTHKLKHTHRGT